MNALGRTTELVIHTNDGSVRWWRELDGTLVAALIDGPATLSRAQDGVVRLAFSADASPFLCESTDSTLTGKLVMLWTLAESFAGQGRANTSRARSSERA